MKYTYFLIFALLTFFSCQNESIPKRVTFKSTPLDSVYQNLRPEVQAFSISNNQPSQIKATKGTEIFVPENSFVDASGNPIKGKVEVKLIEAFAIEDFITSGLATQSNGRLLISNGMINIDATAGGETVALAEGKELTVSMPTMERNMEGFQMFTGDGQNWEADSSMMEEDYLIPVPLELLYQREFYAFQYYNIEEEVSVLDSFLESQGISLGNNKYENTIIATEAFQKRFQFLWSMTHNISFLESKDYYYGKGKMNERKINLSILNTYFENLDKPIEELDKLVKQKYFQYINKNEKELTNFFENYHEERGGYLHFKMPWVYYGNRGYSNVGSREDFLLVLDYFTFPEKGDVKVIDNYGIDLNAVDASNQLKEKGLSPKEINEILTYNFKRNAILNKLKREKEAEESHAAISDFYETTSFSAKKLGWINCDRFYDLPDAKEAKILASNSSKTDLNYIDFSLIFPKLNARLSAFKNEDGKYAFTQNGIWSKLPIGEKAIVTAISFQNDSVYFAAQPIVIEEDMQVDLDLKMTTKEELKNSLSLLF